MHALMLFRVSLGCPSAPGTSCSPIRGRMQVPHAFEWEATSSAGSSRSLGTACCYLSNKKLRSYRLSSLSVAPRYCTELATSFLEIVWTAYQCSDTPDIRSLALAVWDGLVPRFVLGGIESIEVLYNLRCVEAIRIESFQHRLMVSGAAQSVSIFEGLQKLKKTHAYLPSVQPDRSPRKAEAIRGSE
ncbi:hypothetical protein NEOLEDRAFT_746729 [Neolentinus lepideus HHB14362 ss-1]|uniref:Uncharacterized protein n=1 Tax=Neolentinus lepideus HHB14362 ss-1 TaxID=1314782 RepID=A0A165PTA0_9AGAM|nr:hypothetical protein NEOLEDRAFT_746729 [Neolentinus lepideus HHB14362 ss-1]